MSNQPQISVLNPHPKRLPGPSLLHELVSRSRDNAKTAVDFLADDGTRCQLSFERLHGLAEVLSDEILTRCHVREDRPGGVPFVIPVLVPQSTELYVAILGILKSGAAYCPIGLDSPRERVLFILGDVEAKVVVTTAAFKELFDGQGGISVIIVEDVLSRETSASRVAAFSAGLAGRAAPEDLAYIMYTSGSTGQPKGVGVSHGAVTQSLLAHDRHIPPFSRFLQFAAPTFDVSVFEIFFPLFRGVTLVATSRARLLNNLPEVLRSLEVDACELTPTVAGSLLRSRKNAPGLRLLLTIGEMLTPPVIAEFGGTPTTESILWAMYGPTEATIHCTLQPCMDATSSPGNIGFPLDTVSAFVIQINEGQQDGQAKFQPVPVGEVGELAVGGYQLASSYINRAAQTAAVFVDTPWGRAYRTGDKARMRDDGTIECLGRISEGQVKLRGQRMELGEIEQAALRTPGCHGAVAAVISNVLVLFCAADEEPAVESKILKTCMAWLPRSMVPGDVVVAQEFPRLASGKVDRKRLIEQYASTSVRESQQAEARPLSPTERLLLESCRGILSKTVDPKTVLSTAGMDSLTAIKFVSDLRTRGLAVSVLDVLKSRTIAALAKTLDSTRLKPQTSGVRTTASEQDILKPEQCGLAHLKDSIQAILPCSSLQAAMLSETLRDSQAYCNWVELEFPSDYETAQIRNAFCSVFKRFEIYRTGFKIWDDRILQVIWKDFPSQQVTMVRKFDRAYQLETEDELLHPLKLQFLEGTESPRRVLLQLHHALYDGWSLDMLILDLDDCLNMRPAAPRIQFREMCGALQALHCGLDRDAEEEFWTSYLQGFQVPSSPVIKRDHPTDASMLSYAKSFSSSPREVEESMRWLEISPAVLFQAATLVVWSLIVGSSDTLIGTVTSGRTIDLTGVEETVGPCMETRPLRLDLKDVDSIEQLLDMVQSSNRSVIENTKISLQAIKRIQGVRPGQQLFDVLFVYQQSIFSDDARRSCVKVVGHQDHLESRLLVEVYEDGDKLICQLSADAAFIDEILLRKVADMIDSVTVHILRNPKSSVAALARCFPSGLLSISNPVPCRYTGSEDLARRVEAVAASHSQRPALSFLRTIGDRKLDIVTLSFGQLNATANRIASYVRSLQSNLGTVIGIVMEKSPALYASILAILKLGCAYLPLLPSTPTARVSSILSQAGVSICLVDSETQGKLRDVPNCLAINSADGDLSRHSEENICPPVDLESPSYVIYTSGTTGSPKGVLVSHRSVLSNIDALSRIYPFSPSSRMLQACSQAFDVSVFEIFFSWLNGICLCATTNDMLFSDIEGCINALGVTHLSMTTTVASLLKVERLQAVEFLVTSGEPMTESVFTSWVGRLYQGYGPSETTNICTVRKMEPHDHIRYLGQPLQNTSAMIVDTGSLDVLPYGAIGELCFGGDQVALGYLNQQELTEAKFVMHPEHGRIYRSGDLGRMLPDGSIIILGRVDDQVKLHGLRIEPGEISAVLQQHSSVEAAATVLATGGSDNEPVMVSFYVPLDQRQTATSSSLALGVDEYQRSLMAELLDHLRSRLPDYMVPAWLIPVSRIPTTSSGKIDKDYLRHTFSELGAEFLRNLGVTSTEEASERECWSSTERTIIETLAKTLSIDGTSIRRWISFASLGLDSISAITFAQRLSTRIEKRITVSNILQNPTIGLLSVAIENQMLHASSTAAANLDVFPKDFISRIHKETESRGLGVKVVLPCTPLQEAMVVSGVKHLAYVNRMLFRLNGDISQMQRAWEAMVRRHDIFRTFFIATPVAQFPICQVVTENWELRWESFDTLDRTLLECVAAQSSQLPRALDSFQSPYSLAIIVDGSTYFLSFVCHHALYDGVAMSTLMHEIEKTVIGQPLEAVSSYESFLQEALTVPPSSEEFWYTMLRGFAPVKIPRQSSEISRSGGEDFVTSIPREISLSSVDSFARRSGVSRSAVFETVWAIALCILTRRSDICFGKVMSGRSAPVRGIKSLVAPTFNTVPIRADLADFKLCADALRNTDSLGISLYTHQFAPLKRLKRMSAEPEKSLFDTVLLIQEPAKSIDPQVWTLVLDEGSMDVPLVCELMPELVDDSVTLRLHWDRSQFTADCIDTVAQLFLHALFLILQGSKVKVPQYEDLPPGIRDSLEVIWKGAEKANEEDYAAQQHPSDVSNSEQLTTLEAEVLDVLAKVSGKHNFARGRQTTIYQLGLDSISALQVAFSIRQKFAVDLNAADVLECPTCESLAAKITDLRGNGKDNSAITDATSDLFATVAEAVGAAVDHSIVETILPCTPLQEGMLVESLKSNGHKYLNFFQLRLTPTVDVGQIRQSLLRLPEAHPILRTVIIPVECSKVSYAMLTHAGPHLRLPVSVKEEGDFDREEWMLAVRRRVVELSRLPLWDAVILSNDGSTTIELALHHVLYDAHSLSRLLRDLAQATEGRPVAPSPDLAEAVRGSFRGFYSIRHEAEPFWKGLASRAVPNQFPTLISTTSNVSQTSSVSRPMRLSRSAVQEATSSLGVTIQAVMQSAWVRILSAYHGENAVVFGTVLSARSTSLVTDTVFPLINTVPVVFTNKPSNRELLDDMMALTVSLYRHQHAPLTLVKQWLGCADRTLFDTVVVYQPRRPEEQFDRCHMEIFEDQSSTDYTLSVELEDDGSSDMAVRVTFLDSVIPRGQAEFLARQFDACFSHLLQCPDASEKDLLDWDISVFSVVSPRIPELPSDVALLHDFVESSAKASPDSTALVFAERLTDSKHDMCQWSYRQLDERGNQVANLISGAVRLGDVVAVQFEKRPEAYFSILGILKVGCSFVALDPGAPPARRKYILEDSKAVALLVGKHGQRTLGFEAEIPVLEIVEEALDQLPSSIPVLERAVTPNDTCYILYTSGTTGMPKGCMITHDNAVQAMLAFQHLFAGHWDRTSRWLQFASFHFDVSVLEQYWSWSVGITLVSAPRDVMLEDIAYTISALDITHIDLTPSLARLVQPENAPSLCRGIFITGGEQLRQEVLDSWGKTGVIYNAYGPTEATIGVTMYQNVPQNARTTNIGSAFPNVGAYVLSVGTELPVLRGGIGELCVAGRLVGRGYVNRDELTASRFPTLSRFGQRVYRTGDLVRLLDDGSFDFLGRADDQVKLRGQRLEISEVNHAIKDSVPDISDVVTTVVDKLNGDGAQLVSFVTMKGDTRGDRELRIILEGTSNLARDILHACRHRLPNYMVPTFVLRIPYIPLSPNNKADIRVLKDLFRALPREQLLAVSSSQAQSTSAACVTASTVIQCLRDEGFVDSDNIAVDANVFELGVDSISVLRLARRLVRAGLPHTSPATILQRPRIRDLAEALEHSTATAISSSQQQNGLVIRACFHQYQSLACHSLGVTPDAIEYIAPCSALQQGIISRALQSQHQGLYFNAFRFLSQDGVSASHLQSAWERVTDRFAILRTNFISTDDGHVQVALKKISRHILRLDASSLHEIDGIFENAKRQWIAENSGTIAAPFEVVIVQCGNIVEFQVHLFHGIYDGVAFDLLMERLSAEYQGKVSSRPVPTFLDALAAGPLQDFSFSRNFWEDHMLGSTLVRFPRMHEVTLETASITATRTMPFDLESARLKLRTTHHAVVQALWVSLLQKFAPEVNITGVLLSGRSIPMDGVEDVVGPLFNTVPFHWRLRRSTSWNKLVQDCHAFVSSAISFAHVPLRLIQKWTTHGHAAFDTLFSFRRQRKSQGPDPPLWTQTGNESIADYPLACEAELADDGTLMVTLVAQTAIADSSVLTDMLDYLESSTNRLCSDPDSEVEHGGSGRIQPCVPSGGNDAATNGSPRSSSPPLEVTPSTSWDATSLAIREEIASIAGVPPSTIREDVPILELGLDSIDAIKLSSRLRKRGLVATSTNLMQWRTVAKIRQHCSIHQMSSASADNFHRSSPLQAVSELLVGQIGGKADDLERALPTTPLQDIMVAEMISSNFVSYFTHETLELGRHVDTDRLISAWHRIVAANPILRTSFTAVTDIELDHAYCQLVRSTDKSIIRHRELLSLDDIHTVLTEARDAADEANGHSALVQLSFVTVGDRRFLILSLAHALYDGWSIQLLHRDIQAAYAGSISRRPFWERHISRVLGSATQDAADFWTNYLKDITPTLILKRQQRTFERTQKLHRREIISQVRLTAARKFCKAQSVTLQTLGMACWSAVLAHRVRCVDVAFGVVLSGRETEEDQETMFPMMNTVIARCLLHGSASQYLRYVQHNTAQILQFQHFPLRKAQRLARRSGGPIFNTLFIHQTSPPSDNVELPEDGRVLRPVDSEASLDFPVCVEIEAKGDTLVWRVGCSGSYLSEHESDETVANLDKVLRFIVRNPDASFLTLSGSQAKVCALPSFVIRSQESTNGVHEPDANGGAGKPQQWSLNELPVVEALARISGHDISAISRHNNVYHLGLDSISVIKVSALLRKDGVLLKPDDMLTAESINELFLRVAHNSLLSDQKQDDQTVAESNKHASLPALDTVGLLQRLQLSWEHVERVIPATPMQVYMISVWQNSHGRKFFPKFRFALSGHLSIARFKEAWEALVAETPVLRTTFVTADRSGIPFAQIILDRHYFLKEAAKDLDNDSSLSWKPQPLGRAMYALAAQRQDERTIIITLHIHHALYDAISLDAITRRLVDLCMQLQERPGFATERLQVDESLEWQRFVAMHSKHSHTEARRAFWVTYLTPSPKRPVPLMNALRSYGGQSSSIFKPSAFNVHTLKGLCNARGLSFQALFFACYARVLYSLANTHQLGTTEVDVVFGIYVANRSIAEEVAETGFPTLAILPLKVTMCASWDAWESAQRVQDDLKSITAPANATVALWEVATWTGLELQSFVNFLGRPESKSGESAGSTSISIRQITQSLESALSDLAQTAHGAVGEDILIELSSSTIRASYPEALDIEAAVNGDELDIGVFGTSEDGEQGQRIVAMLCTELRRAEKACT